MMRRTQVQLDNGLYEKLRRRAYERRTSLSAVVRETLANAFDSEAAPTAPARQFSFIGAGRSRQRKGHPVSVHHDEAIANIPRRPRRRR